MMNVVLFPTDVQIHQSFVTIFVEQHWEMIMVAIANQRKAYVVANRCWSELCLIIVLS